MYYKYQYPTISFILANADRPEAFREQTRHAPTFFPAPIVLWLPEIPGRKARMIVGTLRPPQLDLPPDWIQTYMRLRQRAALAKNSPNNRSQITESAEQDDDSEDDESTASVTPATGNPAILETF